MFPPTSRYAGIDTAKYVAPDGREIAYLKRRLLPDPATMTVVAEHVVTQGDRLDNVTARYLGDPEQFWRICDANDAMRPDDLCAEVGRRLRIAMAQAG
jgi:hypothetical protein